MANKYPPVTVGDVASSIWSAIKPLKWWMLLTMIGVSFASLVEIIIPLYYRDFFDLLAGSTDKMSDAGQLIHVISMIFLVNAASWLGWRLSTFTNSHYQSMGNAYLKTQGFNYLISHSYTFFANTFTGSLTQRINRYSRAFESLSDRIIWNIVPLSIRIVGTVIILWQIKPIITIVVAVWMALFIGFNYVFAKYRLKYDLTRTQADTHSTAVLSDAITNHNTIQTFNGFNTEIHTYDKAAGDQAKATRTVWFLDSYAEAIQAMFIIVMEFLLFYFAIKYWQAGIVTIGTFVLLQSYVLGLGHRLWDFSRVIRDFYQGFADAKEMVEIMKLPHEIRDMRGAQHLVIKKGKVDFKKVTFSFNENRQVLNSINLSIKGGEKVALIGPSGAGKSTFVRLLLRLYEVGKGAILIDGQGISKVTQESLHENISLVPQDPILFHRTLMENIRYGRKDATDDEVIAAARQAHCDEFIETLPKKYETFVGERGIKLSGGERQRVAIARAILKNAPILVLDEATSSLDSHSESLIQDALEKLMKGKTVIVIAHRLSTIQKMDRIIVVKDGEIVEEGSHANLLQLSGGLYQKLWNLQAGGFIKDDGEAVVSENEEEDEDKD